MQSKSEKAGWLAGRFRNACDRAWIPHWTAAQDQSNARPGSWVTWRRLSKSSGTAASKQQSATMPTWNCRGRKRMRCCLGEAKVEVLQMVAGQPFFEYSATNGFGTSFREENACVWTSETISTCFVRLPGDVSRLRHSADRPCIKRNR